MRVSQRYRSEPDHLVHPPVLKRRDFLEFETPILQPIYGGANARPFTTFHNCLGQKLFLRIAPELYLKRLVVGGFERVFEIARNFRNEDIDTHHNPEFTMVEIYWAYHDVYDMMDLTEDFLATLARRSTGRTRLSSRRPQSRLRSRCAGSRWRTR